ncbi:MAG: hypothetical protein U1F46_13385 [Marinagarivorans sp.]
MNSVKLIGLVLVVAGALALGYGGFSYTKDTTAVKLGPLELSYKEKQTVYIPIWAGVGALLVGGICVIVGFKRRS